MTSRGRLDTFYCRGVVEAYDRERDARLAFWYKNRLSKDHTDPGYEPSSRIKVWKKRIDGAIVIPNEEIVLAAKLKEKRFHRQMQNEQRLYDSAIIARAKNSNMADVPLLPDMCPASPSTRRKLYHGLSCEGHGRKEYLKERLRKGPDERYRHPLTSNYDVGWRVLEAVPPSELRIPEHALTHLVEDTFHTRNYIPSLNLHKTIY